MWTDKIKLTHPTFQCRKGNSPVEVVSRSTRLKSGCGRSYSMAETRHSSLGLDSLTDSVASNYTGVVRIKSTCQLIAISGVTFNHLRNPSWWFHVILFLPTGSEIKLTRASQWVTLLLDRVFSAEEVNSSRPVYYATLSPSIDTYRDRDM